MKPMQWSRAALVAASVSLTSAHFARAQTADHKPTTDAEKLADALRAGPELVTKNATVLDWPSTPGGEYRVLRQGSSEWTCLPAVPGYPHDEPGCFDPVFLKWIQESLAGKEPHIDRLGISYMYVGAFVPNVSKDGPNPDYHVGPHIMIISPHQDEVQAFTRDGSTGQPYVAHLPHGTQLYLVMPYHDVSQQ
jgi:hypothetical protein